MCYFCTRNSDRRSFKYWQATELLLKKYFQKRFQKACEIWKRMLHLHPAKHRKFLDRLVRKYKEMRRKKKFQKTVTWRLHFLGKNRQNRKLKLKIGYFLLPILDFQIRIWPSYFLLPIFAIWSRFEKKCLFPISYFRHADSKCLTLVTKFVGLTLVWTR